jgi:hypothetical protein
MKKDVQERKKEESGTSETGYKRTERTTQGIRA